MGNSSVRLSQDKSVSQEPFRLNLSCQLAVGCSWTYRSPFSPIPPLKLIGPEEEAGAAIGRDRGGSDGKLQMGIILTRGSRWTFSPTSGGCCCSASLLLPRLTAGNALPALAQASAHRARRSPMPGAPNHHPNNSLLDPRPKNFGKFILAAITLII